MTTSGETREAPAKPELATRVASLDDFARITARLDGGQLLDVVLAEEGLTAEAWLRIQQDWLSRMATLACRGRRQLHDRYLQRLASFSDGAVEADEPKDLPLVPSPRIVVARAHLLLSEPAPARAAFSRPPPALTPSVSPPGPMPEETMERPPDSSRTLFNAVLESPPEAVPFRRVASALPFAEAERGERSVPRDLPPALPFDEPTGGDEPDIGGGTIDGSVRSPFWSDHPAETLDGSDAAVPSPLPFADRAGARASEGPPNDESWPFRRGELEVVDEPSAVDPYAGLPFTRSQVPPPPPVSTDAPDAGGTYEIPPVSTEEDRVLHLQTEVFPAIAVQPAAPNDPSPLTLEQYAWLTSLLDRAPERENETLAWLHLTVDRKVAVDAHFAQLFARRPEQKARFDELRSHYDNHG